MEADWVVRDEVAAEAAAEEVSKDIALFVFNKLDPGSVEEKQSGSGIKKSQTISWAIVLYIVTTNTPVSNIR